MKPDIEFMSSGTSEEVTFDFRKPSWWMALRCPKGGNHEWAANRDDPRRKCKKCGKPGRGDAMKGEAGNLSEACQARYEIFKDLKAPVSAHGGKKK